MVVWRWREHVMNTQSDSKHFPHERFELGVYMIYYSLKASDTRAQPLFRIVSPTPTPTDVNRIEEQSLSLGGDNISHPHLPTHTFPHPFTVANVIGWAHLPRWVVAAYTIRYVDIVCTKSDITFMTKIICTKSPPRQCCDSANILANTRFIYPKVRCHTTIYILAAI